MKRMYVGLLIVVFCMGFLAGCGQEGVSTSESNEKVNKKVIGVLMSDFSDQFMAYVMDGMKREAENLPDNMEVVYVDAKYDANKQLSQAENFIAEKVDAIVMVPVDTESAGPIADIINKAEIPLITVNRKLPNEELALSYAGSSCIESGEIEMQAVADILNGKGNIVAIHGFYGHGPQIERAQGIQNVLDKHPDIKILAENTGKWDRAEGMKVMENWLQSDLRDEIDAVVAHNDEMAIGAMKAIEDAGLLDKIIVAGIDATPEALDYLKEGTLNITVFQDAKGQGAKGIEIAAKVINGEEVEKEYLIPYELVNPEEADKYMEKYK